MKKKNPTLAAVIGFVLGPLGLIYVGWRFAVMGLLLIAMFGFASYGLLVQWWTKLLIGGVFAWKAFHTCSVRNRLIERGDPDINIFSTFSGAMMAATDMLVGIGMAFIAAAGLFSGAVLLMRGQILNGLLVLFIVTSLGAWLAEIVFGFIATCIDAPFLKGKRNIFRRNIFPGFGAGDKVE